MDIYSCHLVQFYYDSFYSVGSLLVLDILHRYEIHSLGKETGLCVPEDTREDTRAFMEKSMCHKSDPMANELTASTQASVY